MKKERRKDAHDREAIVARLKKQLRRGDKSLVGNKDYRRYLKVEGTGRFALDEKPIKAEARYDGLWVYELTLPTTPKRSRFRGPSTAIRINVTVVSGKASTALLVSVNPSYKVLSNNHFPYRLEKNAKRAWGL
jgi:hypothetical protein